MRKLNYYFLIKTMDNIESEISRLRSKVIELERIKNIQEATYKKESIEHNLNIINNVLKDRKQAVSTNNYSKVCRNFLFIDRRLVTYLDAIFNVLQVLNKRLDKLEKNTTK